MPASCFFYWSVRSAPLKSGDSMVKITLDVGRPNPCHSPFGMDHRDLEYKSLNGDHEGPFPRFSGLHKLLGILIVHGEMEFLARGTEEA